MNSRGAALRWSILLVDSGGLAQLCRDVFYHDAHGPHGIDQLLAAHLPLFGPLSGPHNLHAH